MKKPDEKPVVFHATKQTLLDTVLVLLETHNPQSITVEQVLAKARISSGSLYHHFEDFPDLLEQALCKEFEDFTTRTIELLLMANQQATTLQSWAEGVNEARKISHGPAYARKRALRVWAVAYSTLTDRMKKRLGEAQDRLNEKFIQFVEEAQQAGWVKAQLDAHAVSLFIQAYQFGGVLDDVSLHKVDQAKWIETLDNVSRSTFIKFD